MFDVFQVGSVRGVNERPSSTDEGDAPTTPPCLMFWRDVTRSVPGNSRPRHWSLTDTFCDPCAPVAQWERAPAF